MIKYWAQLRVLSQMKRVLITGATGNIGTELINSLYEINSDVEVIAAVRNLENEKTKFPEFPNLKFRELDFENSKTFSSAFENIDILFLLRPPQISDVEKYFDPFLGSAKKSGIENIVFLSVQGAEKSSVIPHNKIEKLIIKMAFNYIFVRPSYFMQNLTTNLIDEIVNAKSITLPSGNAKFNWIDAKNIGEATARLIIDFSEYKNQSYEITGLENKNFSEVIDLMNEILGENIRYNRVNPIRFYFMKKKQRLSSGFALVMTILHFLPRLQKEPDISDNYLKLTGKNPTSIKEFISREKEKFKRP